MGSPGWGRRRGDDAKFPLPPPDNRAPNTAAGGAGAGRGPGVPLRGERPGARYRPRRRRRPTHAPPPPPRRSGAERDAIAPEPPPPPQVIAAPGRARGGAPPLLPGAPGAVSPGRERPPSPILWGCGEGGFVRGSAGACPRVSTSVCARSHVPAATCLCLQAGVRVCVCLRVRTRVLVSLCVHTRVPRAGCSQDGFGAAGSRVAPRGGVTGGTAELRGEKGAGGRESFGAACVIPACVPRATWPRAGVGALCRASVHGAQLAPPALPGRAPSVLCSLWPLRSLLPAGQWLPWAGYLRAWP